MDFHACYSRFVNVLIKIPVEIDQFWIIVKGMRLSLVRWFDSETSCNGNIMLSDLQDRLKELENQFGIESNYDILKDVSKETIDVAAKMFVYIIFCPDKYGIVKPLMYVRDGIILSSNSIRMLTVTVNNLRNKKMMPKFMTEFLKVLDKELNLHFHDIDKLTGKCENDCTNGVPTSLLEDKDLQRLVSHPVHILGEDGKLSPSALIPFCWFGAAGINLGKRIDNFKMPICTGFKPKLRNDQVCYEMDPNNFISRDQKYNLLRHGLYFIVDENVNRQVDFSDLLINAKGQLDDWEKDSDLFGTGTTIMFNSIGINELNSRIYVFHTFSSVNIKTLLCYNRAGNTILMLSRKSR